MAIVAIFVPIFSIDVGVKVAYIFSYDGIDLIVAFAGLAVLCLMSAVKYKSWIQAPNANKAVKTRPIISFIWAVGTVIYIFLQYNLLVAIIRQDYEFDITPFFNYHVAFYMAIVVAIAVFAGMLKVNSIFQETRVQATQYTPQGFFPGNQRMFFNRCWI